MNTDTGITYCDLSSCMNFAETPSEHEGWTRWKNKDLCPQHEVIEPIDEWAALSPAMRAAIFEVMKVIGAEIID